MGLNIVNERKKCVYKASKVNLFQFLYVFNFSTEEYFINIIIIIIKRFPEHNHFCQERLPRITFSRSQMQFGVSIFHANSISRRRASLCDTSA